MMYELQYDKIAVGERIRQHRSALGFTQEKVAEMIGRVPRFYTDIERGVSGMSIPTLLSICAVLKTSPDALLLQDNDNKSTKSIEWIVDALSHCTPKQQENATELIKLFLRSIC